jgi:uracil-DNA glycosylase
VTMGLNTSTRPTVQGLRVAASVCRACPLWQRATQTVFGVGRARVPLILVGEQARVAVRGSRRTVPR